MSRTSPTRAGMNHWNHSSHVPTVSALRKARKITDTSPTGIHAR